MSNINTAIGGLLNLAIASVAALAVINMTNNAFDCMLCGYRHQNKENVINHVKHEHPWAIRQIYREKGRLPFGMTEYGSRLERHRRAKKGGNSAQR
jgi:hypothetical protein